MTLWTQHSTRARSGAGRFRGPGKWRRGPVKLAVVVSFAAACLLAASVVPAQASATGSQASAPTLYVFAWGMYTAPALGAAFPPQTYMTGPPEAVVKSWNKTEHGKFKVSYTFCNTFQTPTGSQACARQAISPTGCAGHPCDVGYDIVDLDDALSVPTIGDAGLPVVGEDVNSTQAIDTKNLYCLSGTLEVVEQGLGQVLKTEGVTKAGYVGFVTSTQVEAQDWVTEGLRSQHITLTGTVNVPDTQSEMGPSVSTVLPGNANGLVLNAGAVGEGPGIEYTRSTYPKVKIALPSYVYAANFVHGVPNSDLVGLAVTGWEQPITATKVPGVKDYWDQYGHTVSGASGFRYYDNELLSWLGMKFIINVASTVKGPLSKTSMLRALHSAKNINMYGVMPPYNSASRGKKGAVACSPYYVDVDETTKNIKGSATPVQVATHPGVFVNPRTGKVVYVDPGFKA